MENRVSKDRISAFLGRIPERSVTIIPAAPEAVRSNDTHFRYRPDSDFFYLTQFDEPEAIAVISNGNGGGKYTLFVRPRDPEKEIWDGRRAGVDGAREHFGADEAFPIDQFKEKLPELLRGATTVLYRLGGRNAELDETVLKA